MCLSSPEGQATHTPGQPLDAATRAYFEPRFGHDFSRVRVHTDSRAAESAHAVDALAYTVGRDIVMGAGQYQPQSQVGQQLLAHELTHVVQQDGAAIVSPPQDRNNVADTTAEQAAKDTAADILAGHGVASHIWTVASYGIQKAGMGDVHLAEERDREIAEGTIPIAVFIRDVETVERSYPDDTPMEIVTRIRNQYYNGIMFWRLIPDARNYESSYIWDWNLRKIDEQKVGQEAHGRLTSKARENAKEGEEPDNPSPYIRLTNNELVDVGHVLLGLDALLHPVAGRPFITMNIPNIDVASYIADLGIASYDMSYHEHFGKPPSDAKNPPPDPDLNRYYQISAPETDILGDVDSFGLNSQWSAVPGQKLSQALRSYYLGQDGKSATMKNRWKEFCKIKPFSYTLSGSRIVWDAAVASNLIEHVNNFTNAYVLTQDVQLEHDWPHTEDIVRKFLKFVKAKLEAELASR